MSRARTDRTSRIAAYRCRGGHGFKILWPDVDAPLVHPCPSCRMPALRLLETGPDRRATA